MSTKYCLGFILSFFFANIVVAQDDCTLIKKENAKIIASLNEDKVSLNKEIEYYKEVLSVINGEVTAENQDFVFKLVSAEGKSGQNQIVVELLIENIGMADKFQTRNVELIDLKGNIFKTHKISFGGEQSFIEKFQPMVPVKMKIVFEKISEAIPIIKALVINFYGRKYSITEVMFKDLNVEWD